MTRVTTIQNAISVCIAMREVVVSDIRRLEKDAPQTKLAEGRLYAFLKLLSLLMEHAKRFSHNRTIAWFYQCTRQTWQKLIQIFMCTRMTLKKCADQAILMSPLADVLVALNLRTK